MLTALKRALALGRQTEDLADTLSALPESDTASAGLCRLERRVAAGLHRNGG